MARPWKQLDAVDTDEGRLELRQRGPTDFLIAVGGRPLMISQAHRSELEVATLACASLRELESPRVLIGGLGMALTLRAALDDLPATARVTVVELTQRVVEWCRGPLGPLTDLAVGDPRVTVVIDDVARVIRNSRAAAWDAIILDLYEGPNAATQRPDDPLYGQAALERTKRALAADGVLTIWSEQPDSSFETRLAKARLRFERVRSGKGGRRHAIYVARLR